MVRLSQAPGRSFFRASAWVSTSTSSVDTVTNPSIWADAGDVGIIQAGARDGGTDSAHALLSLVGESGLVNQSISTGFAFSGTSSSDITVASGNLRAAIGGQIGLFDGNPLALGDVPDFNINGAVGLLQTPAGSAMLAATFSRVPRPGQFRSLVPVAILKGISARTRALGLSARRIE